MSLIDKMKLRAFEKSLNENKNIGPLGQNLHFDKIKNITILTQVGRYDKNFKAFVAKLKKKATVQVILFDANKDKNALTDTHLFNAAQTTWSQLPPENIINEWQSFKTDLVINYFDKDALALTYLSSILKYSFSVGTFENKWLKNDITIALKNPSSTEFSKMFFYLLQTTHTISASSSRPH